MAYTATTIKHMMMHSNACRRGGTMKSALGMMSGLVLIGMASSASAETLTFTNGFEGIGPHTSTLALGVGGCDGPVTSCAAYGYNTGYSEGGITVRDVITGATYDSSVIVNLVKDWGGVGNYNWYTAAVGYTDITLTNGGMFQTIQFLEGSGHASGPNSLAYELLNQGAVVAAGLLSDNTFCCGNGAGYQSVAFSGGGFDEVRIQGDSGLTAFNPNSNDIMAIDNIIATSVTPLPAALPLFAAGLGVIGLLGRRRRGEALVALAAARSLPISIFRNLAHQRTRSSAALHGGRRPLLSHAPA
jgi:hypothetical protein